MKINKTKYIISFTLVLLLSTLSLRSQTKNDILIYNWFDNLTGKENLDINTGKLHSNPYKTTVNNSMYYKDEKFELGILSYEKQTYYNVNLKYDIHTDCLVVYPFGINKNTGINLNSDKVDSFNLNGKHFVKITKKENHQTELLNGYYEENKISSDFVFYIRHHKDIQKKINDDGVIYKFNENNSFFIEYKKKMYKIKSKNDVSKIFPAQKKQINEFYLINKEIKKNNENQFMENLMRYMYKSSSLKNK
ncbi:hypothetical protein FLSI110296_01305 [Flavobacterium sinopsychrotolerans]|uniref:DKNYY family protein n=1 Tax=Flavobacterium sinopsychrotolerans TaxID=604089 RepID=A0A1H8IC36_9FLAO|nr:hypothetical protein [Flavobacterium sinopsychrotolerans]SEN65742.1 hypothetical protein SAMN04487942_0505 [Flavobacterium sinopsychrotolerans]